MTDDNEKNDLELHVELSKQRYQFLQTRVDDLHAKMDKVEDRVTQLRLDMMNEFKTLREEQTTAQNANGKLVTGAAATVIGGLLSTVIVLIVTFL